MYSLPIHGYPIETFALIIWKSQGQKTQEKNRLLNKKSKTEMSEIIIHEVNEWDYMLKNL